MFIFWFHSWFVIILRFFSDAYISISLYCCIVSFLWIYHLFIHSSVRGLWYLILAIANKGARTFVYNLTCIYVFFKSLVLVTQSKCLSHRIGECLLRNCLNWSKMIFCFCIPPRSAWAFQFFHILASTWHQSLGSVFGIYLFNKQAVTLIAFA